MTQEERFPPDRGCSLHPSCFTCPEPICAYDFPGGVGAYKRYKQMRDLLDTGMDIPTAAKTLNISKSEAEKRFNRARKVVTLSVR